MEQTFKFMSITLALSYSNGRGRKVEQGKTKTNDELHFFFNEMMSYKLTIKLCSSHGDQA